MSMNLQLRRGTREDAEACGVIDFEAFKSISSQHNFPWDFPSVEIATAVTTTMLSNSGFYCVVAELDGRIVGSNFLDERNPIFGVGPISVDPAVQNQTIGRPVDACRDGAVGAARLRWDTAGAGRLPQSLALPVHEARFRHA